MKKIIKSTLISSKPYKVLSRFPIYLWLAFISLVIALSACDKPDLNNFKTPLSVDTFGTRSVDTFSLLARTIKMDSVPSYNFTKDLIGCYYDMIVGKVVASAYISFRLPGYAFKFSDKAVYDSIILTIKFSGNTDYFGNILEPQTLRIFEVTEKMKYDSHYYSTSTPSINQIPIGEWTGFFVPTDTLLKIKLTKEFADKLLTATDDQLSTNEKFVDFFRGIALIPDDVVNQGAIAYFLLNNAKTSIALYYNDTSKHKLVVFPVNAYSARFSNFKHDFTGSEIQTQLSQPQKEFNELILQPMSGTKVSIKIPYIKHMIDSGLIAINRAEIFFPVDISSPYYDKLPASLLLLLSDSLNQLASIADRTEVYYGGLLNKTKTGYSFIITRYIQQLLHEYLKNPDYIEKKTLTLIIPSDNPITATWVKLLNRDQNNKPAIKLKLWYSKM